MLLSSIANAPDSCGHENCLHNHLDLMLPLLPFTAPRRPVAEDCTTMACVHTTNTWTAATLHPCTRCCPVPLIEHIPPYIRGYACKDLVQEGGLNGGNVMGDTVTEPSEDPLLAVWYTMGGASWRTVNELVSPLLSPTTTVPMLMLPRASRCSPTSASASSAAAPPHMAHLPRDAMTSMHERAHARSTNEAISLRCGVTRKREKWCDSEACCVLM